MGCRAGIFSVMHTEASDGWGGQEIRIYREILGMRERGHNVVLAAPGHTKIFERCEAAGVKCFDVSMSKGSFVPSVFRLASIIRDEGICLVATHSSRDGWIGSIAARLAAVPVVRYRHISADFKRDPLTKLAYRHMNEAIITTGSFIKEKVERELGVDPVKVRSITTGVDPAAYWDADGNRVRDEFGIPHDAPVIGCAAVLRSWKGHEYVIDAMPLIQERFPGARLLLAGDGPRRDYLRDYTDKRGLGQSVVFMGHRDDIAEVIASFDVSVLASYASEGVPQFALQSMASGKPVVGTTTGGIPEVVRDGENGIIVPPKDSGAIAEAVIRILGDKGTATGMGETGRRIVKENYTINHMLDRLEALYRDVLAKG